MTNAETYYPRALGYLIARIQLAATDLESPDAEPEKIARFLRQSLERLDTERLRVESGEEAWSAQ